jgi:uncharacterized protein YprB with RNaseH-like and TPR domain
MVRNRKTRCYFDIETSYRNDMTVCGLYYESGDLVQLVGEEINYDALLNLFRDTIVYTYNGSRFDLPVVKTCTGFDITSIAWTHDLMYDCWRNNLYGGLKKVEKQLGISRQTDGMDGHDAMRLWEDYLCGDEQALELLLFYNKEDVTNLEILRKKMGVL